MKTFEIPEIHRYPIIIKDSVTDIEDNPLVHDSNDNELDNDYFG